MIKKFVIISCLGFSLASCASLTKTYDAVTGATVSTEAVYIAANTFDASERTATNYLRLAKCTPTNRPICRDPVATSKIIPAIRSGRVARNNLLAFIKANPGQLGPTGLYNILSASNSTLQGIFTQYNIGNK